MMKARIGGAEPEKVLADPVQTANCSLLGLLMSWRGL